MSKSYTQKCFQVPDASKTQTQPNHQNAAYRALDFFDELIPVDYLPSGSRAAIAKGIINAGTAVVKDAQAEYAALTQEKTLVQRAVIRGTFKVYYPLKKLSDGVQYVQEKASSALRSAEGWVKDTYTQKQK